jgi:hypothetical protein
VHRPVLVELVGIDFYLSWGLVFQGITLAGFYARPLGFLGRPSGLAPVIGLILAIVKSNQFFLGEIWVL